MEENIYKNAKVVVIDDVEEVLNSTKSCLEFEDMQVECFSNPIEGLEYLKTNKADVLLLDFFMPQMNGDEFVQKLREFNNETIVILQTGYSDKIPPLEMIDKMNIQGYLDKLKGEDELVLMTKAAIKTSFLNKQIIEKDREISKLHFKSSITGGLIANLVNEAKDQLMQIAGMNGSIISDTDDYEVETKGISNAVERIGKLYNALNFEYIKTVSLNDLKDIITILLRPTLLISNSTMNIEESESFVIEHNASDIIYFIIESVELLAKDCKNNINIKIQKEEENTKISIVAENFENKDFSNLELLVNNDSIEISNNTITVIL